MTWSRSAGENGGGGDHSQMKEPFDSSKVISQMISTLVLRMWVVFIVSQVVLGAVFAPQSTFENLGLHSFVRSLPTPIGWWGAGSEYGSPRGERWGPWGVWGAN